MPARRVWWLVAIAAGVVAFAGPPAHAQTPDSASVAAPTPPPAAAAETDSLPTPTSRPAATLPDLGPTGNVGRVATPVPAVTPALSAESLLGLSSALSAFDYALGAPGRSAGLSIDGLDPARTDLGLDGRSFDDLVTGAPRFDLLPLAALGPLRVADTRLGQATAVDASVRTFRLGRPVTELRYLAGQSGVQSVAATHAQTRRPPAFLRGGSPDARLTGAGHVASRSARGALAGATLRHTDVLGRALLTTPRLSVDAGVLYTDRTDGARRGVVAGTAESLFSLNALALDPTATRRTLRLEAWTTARMSAFFVQPLSVTSSVVAQRLVYTPGAGDTLRTHARRLAFRAVQPLRGGLVVRFDALADDDPHGGTDLLGDPGARVQVHGSVSDSLSAGRFRLSVSAGGHLVGKSGFPSAHLRAERGSLFAGLRLGGSAGGRTEQAGMAGSILPAAEGAAERTLAAEIGIEHRGELLSLGLRAFGIHRRMARLLAVGADSTFVYLTPDSPLMSAGSTVTVALREATARGVYARLATTAMLPLRPDASSLHRREADALPRLRADLRAGTRARGIGGVLDLDLALVGRGWTGFRSRVVEPSTGLLALPDSSAVVFGSRLPARGTLGAEARATFSQRATLFLQVDHALGGTLVDGAAVVQGEPLAPRVVRFGVFWALLD